MSSIAAVPIAANPNPREGKQAARFQYVLSPLEPSFATAFEMNSAAGLAMSQVMTIYVDNTQNDYALTIVHGVMNETLTVPAFAKVIAPTFSNASNYPLNVAAANEITTQVEITIIVILLNYPRQAGSFTGVLTNAISGTGQATSPIVANVWEFTPASETAMVLAYGNWILTDMDFAFEGLLTSAASGNPIVSYSMTSRTNTSIIELAYGSIAFEITAAGKWLPGPGLDPPTRRSWPNGLMLTPGAGISLFVQLAGQNIAAALVRVNMSGIGGSL